MVGAEGDDGDFYILEDCSGRFSPDQQMRVVAEAYYRNNADCVVAEVNMTGDYMRALLSTVDPNIPLRTVHGMKGKLSRAQGPSSLFMQGRVHMVGDNFRQLEDQLSAMAEGDDRNRMKDDRADACLAEGTLVLTSRGEVPIEQVVPGDLAWTRAGWKPVTATRCTQRNAEVLTVALSDGRELTGTGDHRIWTENKGWSRLDALVWGDILSGWKNPPRTFSTKAARTGATRTVRAGSHRVYYQRRVPGGVQYLHRDVWLDAHPGEEIPDRWHVHHKDEDPFNNDPSNLELLSPAEHNVIHPGDQSWEEENLLEHLDRIRPLAAEWHRSEEGREWHVQHGKEPGEGASRGTTSPCAECGTAFKSWSTSPPAKTEDDCSRLCVNRARDKNPKYAETVTCPGVRD